MGGLGNTARHIPKQVLFGDFTGFFVTDNLAAAHHNHTVTNPHDFVQPV